MAQSGYTPILIYASGTATNVPLAANMTSSASGAELALNYADGKLYYKNSSGVVTLLASSTTVTNSFSAGTTGFTPSTATTGAVTLGGTLITSNGGTGLASYTAGDLFYYASGTALTKLAIGTAGQFLTSTGTAPQWSTLSGVAVTTFSAGTTGFTPNTATSGAITLAGTLATTNGGTGLTSFTSGGVVYASSTSALATGSALTFNGTQLLVNSNSTTASGFFQINDGTTTQANSFGTIVRNSNDGNGRYSLSAWRAQNASGLAQYAYIGAQSVTGASNYTPELVFGLSTGASTYAEQGRWTTTGLGIGTGSPTSKLDVSGVISLQGTTLPSAGTARFFSRSSDSSLYLQTATSGLLYLLDGAQNTMYAAASTSHAWSISNATRLGLTTNLLSLGNPSNVVANAWSGAVAFQAANSGNFYGDGQASNWVAGVSLNSYRSSNDWYNTNASIPTGRFEIGNGASGAVSGFGWFYGAGGTAGALAAQTQFMTLTTTGNLLVGATTAETYTNGGSTQTSKLQSKGVANLGPASSGLASSTTTSGGSLFRQTNWSGPATSLTIPYSSLGAIDNSGGMITATSTNKIGGALGGVGTILVIWTKHSGGNLTCTTVSSLVTGAITTISASASGDNLVITSDANSYFAWTSISAG